MNELAKTAAFRVAVCGKRFARAPAAFDAGRARLGARVVHWGGDDSREVYREWLERADIAVSTARHEFFGISPLEAQNMDPQQRIMLAAGTSQRRICERCNVSKPLDAFRPGRRVCTDCVREQAREYGRTTYRNRKATA